MKKITNVVEFGDLINGALWRKKGRRKELESLLLGNVEIKFSKKRFLKEYVTIKLFKGKNKDEYSCVEFFTLDFISDSFDAIQGKSSRQSDIWAMLDRIQEFKELRNKLEL